MGIRQRKFSGCIRAYKVNDAGVKIGEIFDLGNLATLTLDIKSDIIKAVSNSCETSGQTLNSMARPATASGAVTCEEWVPDMVAEGLNATVSPQTIAASSLADEDVTLVGFGYWAAIGEKRLDPATIVVKDSTGTNTLVKGTDYLVDAYMGIIKPVEGSTYLTTGTEHVLVTATGLADSTPMYTIGAGASGLYAITGKVEDAWSGKNGELFLRKVRLVLTNSVPFVDGQDVERSDLEFEMSPEVVEGLAGFGTFAGEVLA